MNILRIIKNSVPASWKAYVRLNGSRKKYKKTVMKLAKTKKPYVLLLGTALHTNLGDHLIALAEIDWLKKTSDVVEIPREVFHLYKKYLAGITADVYITGGGWMGDLWPNEEKDIQNMVRLFKNNKVTILPQTVFFQDENSPLIKRGNEIYSECKDLTLYIREENSFETAKKLFSIENIVLSPDIGLLYKYTPHIKGDSSVVGICLRDDRESDRNDALTEQVLNLITELGLSKKYVSTMSWHRVSELERKQAVDTAINSFAECGLLIVDRLHAMIFSYLAGRPCIAFDNKTKKVSGVYQKWLSECPYILMVDENTQIADIRNFVQNVQGVSFEPESFEQYF